MQNASITLSQGSNYFANFCMNKILPLMFRPKCFWEKNLLGWVQLHSYGILCLEAKRSLRHSPTKLWNCKVKIGVKETKAEHLLLNNVTFVF